MIMSQETKGEYDGGLIGVLVLTAAMLFMPVYAYVYFEPTLEEHIETCEELSNINNKVKYDDCLDYLEENPNITGQQTVDYFVETSNEREKEVLHGKISETFTNP